MPDILIRGMEMPQSCYTCDIGAASEMDGCCPYFSLHEEQRNPYRLFRHPDCPLLEFPPHGDLIDRDAVPLPAPIEDEYKYVHEIIKEAPVVVPAERRDYP